MSFEGSFLFAFNVLFCCDLMYLYRTEQQKMQYKMLVDAVERIG